jgi:proteasome lid subunit RPN8/RPN11
VSLSLDVRAIDKGEEAKKGSPPKVKQEFRVYIGEDAFDHAVERGGADTTREVGGILVGEVLRDDSGPFIKVDVALDALHAEEKGAELTFTHATWEHLNKEMDTKYTGKKVVGWWHTHPGFGVFLSDRDQFIHRSFFNLPFQIALVYDPKSREHGVFTWRDNEPWRTRRYFVGEREQIWDSARVLPNKDEKGDKDKGKKPARDKASAKDDDDDREDKARPEAEPAPMDWTTVAMAAVFALVLGGLIGYWAGSGRRGGGKGSATPDQIENAQRAYENGQRELAAQINTELLALLRQSLDDESSRRTVEDALNALADAEKEVAALAAPPAGAKPDAAAAAAKVKTARERLARALEMRTVAERSLAALEMAGKGRQVNVQGLVRELNNQQHYLGLAYAELAMDIAKADPKRAKRLLQTAALVDPQGFEGYQARLGQFDKDAKLLRPQEGFAPGFDPPPPDKPAAPTPGPAPAPTPTPAPAKPAAPGSAP